MLLRIPTFNGIAPRTSPRLLGDTFGTIAENTKLWNGSVRPWRQAVKVADIPRVGVKQTIYRFGQDEADDADYWFHWLSDVDVVRSPIAGNERTYFSGDGAPKATDSVLALTGGGAYPNAAYDLGVPSPTLAVTATVSGTPAEGETVTSRFYVYTFVNSWGEEGSVSPVSDQVDATDSQTITLTGFEVPTGAQSYTAKRIYETAGVGESAAFYYKAEIAAGDTSTSFLGATNAVPNPEGAMAVGSPLATNNWTPPPADLIGLTMMAGQIAVGISGNAVRMAEPGYPYAWPSRYEFKFEYDPVAVACYGNTVVVGTKGTPYLIQGYEPGTMQQTKLEQEFACVSKRSMVSIGGGVAYASPDGMIVCDANGAVNVTQAFLDRDQWQAYKPESMHAYWWDSRLVVFYDTGSEQGGLVFEPGKEPTTLDFHSTGCYVDPIRDALYCIVGNEVHRFDATGAMTMVWRSKVFQAGRPCCFGAAQVKAAGTVTARFYADNVLRHTQTVTDENPFRLPAGFLANEWQFELEGTAEVFSLAVAETMRELKGA